MIQNFQTIGVAATRDVSKHWTLKTEYLSVLELSKVKIRPFEIHFFLQIFEGDEELSVAVSPFCLAELPNIRTGIATITTAPDAVKMYRGIIDRLWTDAAKGKKGAKLLQNLLDRF